MSVFKAYDIRGKYPGEISDEFASKLGWAFCQVFKPRVVVVGRDIRLSSKALHSALLKGLTYCGVKVIDIGEVTTPMSYFANGFLQADGSIMITASHNPKDYNGFKICREKAIALSEKSGLKDLENVIQRAPIEKVRDYQTNEKLVENKNIASDYTNHLLKFSKMKRHLKIAIDTANGSVGIILPLILEKLPLDVTYICLEPDGNFPVHNPDPLRDENTKEIVQELKGSGNYDFGAAFDGDGDRCIFFDEKGGKIPSDLITLLIAKSILLEHPKTTIVYDLRSSKVIAEEVEKLGGKAIKERVGHSFIKATMRRYDSLFGGEFSGHYYFKDNFFADSAIMALVYMLNLVSKEDKPLSKIIRGLKRYYHSGEISFEVSDKDAKITKIEEKFKNEKIEKLDGVTVEAKDYWFNVRKSNTEPLLRIVAEAKSKQVLEKIIRKITRITKETKKFFKKLREKHIKK